MNLEDNIKWVEKFLKKKRERDKKKMQNYFTSVVRTVVPYAVGWLVSWALVTFGITVPDDVRISLEGFLTFAIGTAYYVIVRKLEAKHEWVGWLLGSPNPPEYK